MAGRTITLRSGEATAQIALHGAEPVSWTVGSCEWLWHGDPAHWARSAPILFPVVGASAGGAVKIGGNSYVMPQHGFARDSMFSIVEGSQTSVVLRLTDSDDTQQRYPFRFVFEVRYVLGPDTLSVNFSIENLGDTPMPYQLGFHPAFPWPFEQRAAGQDAVIFASDAERPVRRPDANGLMKLTSDAAISGARWPVEAAMFDKGAFVFADAQSDTTAFEWAGGGRLSIATEAFPHVAVWTKPTAPFISVEQWTGLPDWDDFSGELAERASVTVLPPGQTRRHVIRMTLFK